MPSPSAYAALLALLAGPAIAADLPPLVAEGKGNYEFFCAKCHGKDMVNPGTASFDLRKFPHQDRTRFETSVTQGKGDMPAWGDVLLPEELLTLWAYVSTAGGAEPLPAGLAAERAALPPPAN